MIDEERDMTLAETTKQAFLEELNKYVKEQEPAKGSISENAMAEEVKKEDSTPKPYTIEELRELAKKEKDKAIEKVEESRIEPELQEKFKALQGMATKRQQYLAEKEKMLDTKIEEYSRITKELSAFNEKLKEKIKEISEIDPEFEDIMREYEKLSKEGEKYSNEIINKNWQEAEIRVRELFPDFGSYSEQEMTETLKKNPRLLELAQVEGGKYGDIVLAATHILTMLKEENFKKLIERELEENPQKYEDIIDKIIVKKIKEIEEKNEKKKKFTKLTESQKIEPTTTPKQQAERKDYKHTFADEFIRLMNNPDELEEIKSKMKGG